MASTAHVNKPLHLPSGANAGTIGANSSKLHLVSYNSYA